MARPDERIQRRIAFFGVFAAIVFSILLGRLWSLQMLMGRELSAQAESNRIRAVPLNASRGIIYDRNGEILVQNRPSLVISVIPSVVERKPAVLRRLANILEMPLEDIQKKLTERTADPLKPRVLKEDADDEAVVYIKEHQSEFSGVKIQVEGIRDYPYGMLAAHVLGHVGEVSDEELQTKEYKEYNLGDIVGKTGVERTYESFLKGEKGEQRLEVNASGDPLKVLSSIDAIPGHNLVLTLDRDIQQVTEEALEQAIEAAHAQKHPNADAGAAVVMNPHTGEILAMASRPSFDPQLFVGGISSKDWKQLTSKDSGYPLNNRAIACVYPPGSAFKVITGLAGLAERVASPKDSFRCSGRWVQMGKKWPKSCWKKSGHGYQSFVSAVIESCDVYFFEIGYKFYKMGGEKLQDWARKCGLDALTGIDLPFEAEGRVPDKAWKRDWNKNRPEYQSWLPGDTVNLAIGQGDLLTTPMQMANVYAAIANGGRLYQPTVAERLLNSEGRISHDFEPKLIRDLGIEPQTLELMQQSLQLVCERGTGAAAFAGFPQKIAGKTGTAQVRGKDDFAWFACYAPADDPQYVVVVMVEEGGHGGSVSAPAARRILGKLLDIEDEPVKGIVDVSR